MKKVRMNWENFINNPFNAMLIVLLVLFVAGPFCEVEGEKYFSPVILIIYTVTVLAIAVALIKAPKVVFTLAVAKVASLLYVLSLQQSNDTPLTRLAQGIDNFLILGFFAYFIYALVVWLMKTPNVTRDSIKGGICVYILMGYFWAILYRFVTDHDPNAFSIPLEGAANFVYFSFTTLTTVGYGDISPVNAFAKMLANLESVTGQLFLTIFLAKLVGLHLVQAHQK